MAAASTNGKGSGEEKSSGNLAPAPSESSSNDGDRSDPELDVLSRGSTIGRYLVVERLGAGAMGVVFAAYDPELDRKVAIKLLRPQSGSGDQGRRQSRLVREAKAIAKLSHPNVVGIFDVGVHEGQVFLAMEYLSGGTFTDWLGAKKRTWREILDLFIEMGKGLAAAHAEGLIHRDFKPDNVLLDRSGKPKVVDFGLVRLTSGTDLETSSSSDLEPTADDRKAAFSIAATVPDELTRTGALAGTPAYMAPEQFLGKPIDARSDQFSFAVALYEALYGVRPFSGDNIVALADSVTTGRVNDASKSSSLPAWLRRIVLRALMTAPADRWSSMDALIAAMENDPAVKLRRRLIVGAGVVVVAATIVAASQVASRRRRDSEREIARHMEVAKTALAVARERASAAQGFRTRSFAAFDAFDKERGEQLWREAQALIQPADASFDQAERSLDTAFLLDKSRDALRKELADIRFEHLIFADDFRLESKREVLKERLANVDADGAKAKEFNAPGIFTLNAQPVPEHVRLERFDRDASTGRVSTARLEVGHGPLTLAPGSYRLVMDGTGLAHVIYPFEVTRGARINAKVVIPSASSVPAGFVYVPAGESWFGDSNELLRTQFLDTVPLHRRRVEPFLIAKHETTYRDWIAFLDDLDVEEQTRRAPDVSNAMVGSVRLRGHKGDWRLLLQPSSRMYVATMGSMLTYEGRKVLGRQDWMSFPVTGLSPDDVESYVAWLARTGRVPDARLCTEVEWERAARGSDDRVFPHGSDLQPSEANFDLTYGRVASAYGPDAVGAHPASRSPFGIDDLVGNAMEIVQSSEQSNEYVVRGGGYYFGAATCRSTNREVRQATLRDAVSGIRVCASIGGEQ